MLNRYFIRPTAVDRIRSSWIGEVIERYVVWLAEQNYAARNVGGDSKSSGSSCDLS